MNVEMLTDTLDCLEMIFLVFNTYIITIKLFVYFSILLPLYLSCVKELKTYKI